MNEVVVGIDGLDWYQPSKVEPESWLMPAPPAYATPVRQAFSTAKAVRLVFPDR